MKNIVSLLFTVCLLFISFSSCAWFMEVFGEEINEEGIPVENIYLSLNPDKEEYRVGETINIELSGILDFNIHKNYVFDIYVYFDKLSLQKSSNKYKLVNSNDDYYMNSKNIIHYELKESDCLSFEKTDDKENCYKLFKQIPLLFLEKTNDHVGIHFEVNWNLIGGDSFKILPAE